MTLIYKYISRTNLFVLAAVTLTALFFAACSSDSNGGGGGRNSVELDFTKTIYPDKEDATVLLVTGKTGTPWTAEIVSGAEWISFNRSTPGGQTVKTGNVGTSLSETNQYVYYWPNRTDEERHATIRFTFEGETPVDLVLTQYSIDALDNDVYESGQYLAWPEIPAEKVSDNLYYVTHFADFVNQTTGATYNARNYTLCFDKSKRGSWWVAYPLAAGYTGSIARPKPDPWTFDPKLSSDWQANLGAGSYNNDGGFSYDRGHQIANADRNGNSAMQYQTFYNSNATPQINNLNTGQWQQLEIKVRGWSCSDTLYVVTGAYWGANAKTTTDKRGTVCPVPTHYFKVVARTVRGNIRQAGDRLGDYSNSDLMSIGFWVDNAANQGSPAGWIKSVEEIEALTGFEFFPTLSPAVKQQKNASAWGY